MIRFFFFFAIALLFSSCQITEDMTIKEDGSGTIQITEFRHEPSYMKLVGENYGKENIFKDSSYVFKEYIDKYNYNFIKYTPTEQMLFSKYTDVLVSIKKSSFDKEYKSTFKYSFDKVEKLPDLYKTEDYADDLENNYALTAEKHYYNVSYTYANSVFKRTITITNPSEQNIQKTEMEAAKSKYGSMGFVQTYQLNYNFPRKIKSVSNASAKISENRKALSVTFPLSDCIATPEITQLEVILE